MPLHSRKTVYDLSALRILIIDDSDHMLAIVRRLLYAMRVETVWLAADAAEAFQIMRTETPDLIVVDWNMIPLDGIDFIRLVRRDLESKFTDIPVLLLTAHTEPHRVRAARDAGVNHVLAKPVSFKRLYDAITAIIDDERPFVRSDVYVGPDRRWKKGDAAPTERRRQEKASPKTAKPRRENAAKEGAGQ
jgi:two-component system, chemotaxis family, chemotaxis protein CheY